MIEDAIARLSAHALRLTTRDGVPWVLTVEPARDPAAGVWRAMLAPVPLDGVVPFAAARTVALALVLLAERWER